MAKTKTGVNKSELIRSILGNNPTFTAKQVVAKLKENGIDATEALVYAVKQKMKPAAKKVAKKAPAPAAIPAPSSNGTLPASSNTALGIGASISVAKTAAEKVGGWATLKEIVDAMV